MMKILVTGGAGFIGSHVVETYLRSGHKVTVLDNLSNSTGSFLSPQVRLHEVSLSNHKEVHRILKNERPHVVNHHAAQIDIRKSICDPIGDAMMNIVDTLALLESCRQLGVMKIIFASSGGAVYGEGNLPSQEYHPVILGSPYGIGESTVENYLNFYSVYHNLPFVALRYANVYGPRQRAEGEGGVIAVFISRLLKGGRPVIFGDGLQTRDFVFVED